MWYRGRGKGEGKCRQPGKQQGKCRECRGEVMMMMLFNLFLQKQKRKRGSGRRGVVGTGGDEDAEEPGEEGQNDEAAEEMPA